MVYNTLCLSGGGINGLNILGSIKYLIDYNIIKLKNIDTYIGTSVGSLIILLLSIGYDINDLIKIFYEIDLSKINVSDDFDLDYIIENLGINNASKIILIIQTLLHSKCNKYDLTFQQHYEITNKKIKIVAVNFTKKKEEIFSVDTHPNMSVILAIRMSICIPFIFTPVKYNGDIYIDGGIINNFAFNYCNKDTSIGICLSFYINSNELNLMNYFFGLLSIIFDNCNNNSDNENVIKLNIEYDTFGDFSPNKELKQKLLKRGYRDTNKFCCNNLNFLSTQFVNNIIDSAMNELMVLCATKT